MEPPEEVAADGLRPNMDGLGATAEMDPSAVAVRGISKRFGAVQALDDVSIAFRPGNVHAVVGENGAGKSTLTKIIAGAQSPDVGEVRVAGRVARFRSPADALAAGVSVIYQELSLVPELSVAANLFLGQELRSGGLLDERSMYARTQQLLERLGGHFDGGSVVGELSLANQQIAEIARALNRESRVIIMDEPTAALPAEGAQHLFGVIRALSERGTCIIYISHELQDVFDICDRLTVMKDGRHVLTDDVAAVTRDDVIRAMVGRTLGELFPERPPKRTDAAPVLEVDNLSLAGHFSNVSLRVAEGEILGLAGLVGSGRSSVARAIFGCPPGVGGPRAVRGRLRVLGKRVRVRRVRDAIRAGLAYVPEERKTDGLALDLAIVDNIALPQLRRLALRGVARRAAEVRTAVGQVEALDIRTPSVNIAAGNLSGGNQQKVVLGKWLATGCRLLILDEPTRGVDLGAKAEIYALLRRLTAAGMAVLLVSSDLPEVLGLSDRIVVMRRGRVVEYLDHDAASEEAVIRLALGTDEDVHDDAG